MPAADHKDSVSRRYWPMLRLCLVVAIATLVGLSLTVLGAVWALGRSLDMSRPVGEPAEVIFVLGGELSGARRTKHAVHLYDQGIAPQVVISGGRLVDFGIACTSTDLSVANAAEFGLPPDAITIAPEAQSTYDEAVNLAAMAAANDWRTLLLVTDRFHTRRAWSTFRTLMPHRTILVSAPDDPRFNAVSWWSTEEGLVSGVTELLKLGFYWVEYDVRPW